MTTLTIYAQRDPEQAAQAASEYQRINTASGPIFIRVYVRHDDSLEAALEKARPTRGEIVLNTIEAPVAG